MKQLYSIVFLFVLSSSFAQSLPIDFESSITTTDFVNFDGGEGTVISNPQSNGINTSSMVAQIVRDGGTVWAGSKIILSENLDFSSNSILSMKVFTTAPIGTTIKFKLEGGTPTEKDVLTKTTSEWETLTWDFTGAPNDNNQVVFMFDFGNMNLAISTNRGTYDWFIEQRFIIIFGVASFFSFLPTINFIEKNMNPFFGTQGEKDFIFIKSILAIKIGRAHV